MTAPVIAPRRREGGFFPKLVAIVAVVAVAALLYLAVSWATSFIEWLFSGSSSASPISHALRTLLGLGAGI
jgi:hypothetical protein